MQHSCSARDQLACSDTGCSPVDGQHAAVCQLLPCQLGQEADLAAKAVEQQAEALPACAGLRTPNMQASPSISCSPQQEVPLGELLLVMDPQARLLFRMLVWRGCRGFSSGQPALQGGDGLPILGMRLPALAALSLQVRSALVHVQGISGRYAGSNSLAPHFTAALPAVNVRARAEFACAMVL